MGDAEVDAVVDVNVYKDVYAYFDSDVDIDAVLFVDGEDDVYVLVGVDFICASLGEDEVGVDNVVTVFSSGEDEVDVDNVVSVFSFGEN